MNDERETFGYGLGDPVADLYPEQPAPKQPMPTPPIMVSVPLEALEAAPRIRQCDRAECKLYATLTATTGAPFVRRIEFLCDTHAQGAHTKAPTCWADHARALNRAIEWGQRMRQMKEGKL